MRKYLILLLATYCCSLFASETFKVLTLNMWSIPAQRKMVWARAEAVGRQMHNYDFVLFQEVFTKGVRATINHHSQVKPNRFQTRPLLKLNSGLFSYSRYNIIKSGFRRFSSCKGIQCFSAKGILFIRVELENGLKIDLYNTHLQAFQKDKNVRKVQLNDLRKIIDQYSGDGKYPVIVAGDMNIVAGTKEHEILKSKLSDFQDSWTTLRPKNPGFTWRPDINYWAKYDDSESPQFQRLDYIFYRDGEQAGISLKDVSLAFDQESPWYGKNQIEKLIYVSDHFGVEAEFIINKK